MSDLVNTASEQTTSEKFWTGLQADFDREEAQKKPGNRLQQEVQSHAVHP